jgi:hypothetical protein
MRRAVDENLQGEHSLPAPRAAHEQRCAPPRQAARGDVIEALDPAGNLLQRFGRVGFSFHESGPPKSNVKYPRAAQCPPIPLRWLCHSASYEQAFPGVVTLRNAGLFASPFP